MPILLTHTQVTTNSSASHLGGPKRPGPSYGAKLARGLMVASAVWLFVEATGMLWRAGEELPVAIGISNGAFSQYELCNKELKAAAAKDVRPSLAMLESSAMCFTGEKSRSPESVKMRVESALAFTRETGISSRMEEFITNLSMAVTSGHREMLAAEGARMDPSTSSGVGIMLGLRQIAMWQEESLATDDMASIDRARELARSVSRMGIKGMMEESERIGSIDRRGPVLEWLARLTGTPHKFFGDAVDLVRQKTFMSYWSLWHPVAAIPGGEPNFPAIVARRTAGEAWVATMPSSVEAQESWLMEMERLAPAIAR